MCVWRTVCAYGHLIVDGNNIVKKKKVHKRYLQRTQNLGYVFNDQFNDLREACLLSNV